MNVGNHPLGFPARFSLKKQRLIRTWDLLGTDKFASFLDQSYCLIDPDGSMLVIC